MMANKPDFGAAAFLLTQAMLVLAFRKGRITEDEAAEVMTAASWTLDQILKANPELAPWLENARPALSFLPQSFRAARAGFGANV